MKKLTGLLLAIMLTIGAFAGEIKFANGLTWNQIKEKAAREKKMIFFDAYTSWCGPCKYLEKEIYTNTEVADYYNANFINVKFDMEKGEGISLAEELGINSYPTLMFFSPEGKLVHKYIGAMGATEFMGLGKDALDPSRQYFALKEKAIQLKLSDADFTNWASQADKLEDADKEKIMADYLRTKPDILGNKDIATTVLLFDHYLDDQQLSYLHTHKARIGELMEWDAERTNAVLYKKLFRQAAVVYERSGNNIDSFRTLVRKFDPQQENFAVKDLHYREAVFVEKDMNKASSLLLQYLQDTKQPADIDALAGWLLDYSSSYDESQIRKISAALDLFKLRSMDKGKEYWLYLMQVICAVKTGDTARAKTVAGKAYHHAGLPVEYKEILKETYGFTD